MVRIELYIQDISVRYYQDLQSRGQEGNNKQCPDRLETHTHEYFTGTNALKIKNAITKESSVLVIFINNLSMYKLQTKAEVRQVSYCYITVPTAFLHMRKHLPHENLTIKV